MVNHKLYMHTHIIRYYLNKSALLEGDSLAADESPIGEALNAAWAMHEFTSRYAAEMLGFCEGQPLPSRP